MSVVEELKNQALSYMALSGFPVHKKVTIAVDEKLPFMGYTTEKDGRPHIVIAKWALGTEMVMGLLIHELSHVYRIETNHPSHNNKLHKKVLLSVLKKTNILGYQQEILRNVINNIQDLYADDLSFAVYKAHLNLPNLNTFFLGWIRDPYPPTTLENKWKNAASLLNSAFAKANLARHAIPDTDDKVAAALTLYLKKCDVKVASKFNHFTAVMTTLPDPISDTAFEKLLTKYLQEFLKLTK